MRFSTLTSLACCIEYMIKIKPSYCYLRSLMGSTRSCEQNGKIPKISTPANQLAVAAVTRR